MPNSTHRFVVYKITNIVNRKLYIGCTTCAIHKRLDKHISAALSSKWNYPIYNAIRKHGKSAFSIEEIERCDSRTSMLERECYWIKTLETLTPNGYNATPGGEGVPKTPEMLQKMARTLTGRRLSDDHRMNISISATGHVVSADVKKRMSKIKRVLTDAQAAVIKFNSLGVSLSSYAEMFGIEKSVAWKIRSGRSYRDIVESDLPE